MRRPGSPSPPGSWSGPRRSTPVGCGPPASAPTCRRTCPSTCLGDWSARAAGMKQAAGDDRGGSVATTTERDRLDADAADGAHDRRTTVLRLVLGSCVMLFLELALIRWLGANIVHLSYFTNFVLLGSFLGIGLGFLIARKSWSVLPWTPVL